jgi:DNA-binding NarL/FixJ family response regulator
VESQPLGVFVVSDDVLARSALGAIVRLAPTLELVGEAAESGFDSEADIDVVLWDVAEPTSAALGAAVSAGARVLAVVASEGHAADALESGVRGVLSRGADSRLIEAAARTVARGALVLDGAFERRLVLRRATPSPASGEALTQREQEVIALMARGLGNKLIAAELGVTENTVKFHVNSIFEKLDASSRTEAVVRAVQLGLVLV